ncbi:MAG TPA: RNase A-like domain-containing protein [Jatrophihabitans sp.]|jgi:uncharacterized protein YukE|uniref:RNase A-like domain-containing protein n=1 Tax=Jatrophihabitans sp. TaxID=1932789 RepID=UPI002EE2446C
MTASRFELPGDGLLAARACLDQRMPAGDPVRIRAAAHRCGRTAADLRRAASALLSSADTPLWTGAAHRAFVEQLRDRTPSMSATADRYEHYASALHAYAGALDETAPWLRAVRHRLRQRHDELASRDVTRVDLEATGLSASRADTAELLLLARNFKAGYDRWADALDRCIRALFEADEADPTRDRSGWAAWAQQLTGAVARHLSPYQRALANPTLANISDCLSTLATDLTVLGLGLLLICPPAAGACLAVATVLALTQLAVDATRRTQGEQVSNATLGLQLAAAIPIGGSAVRGLRAAGNVTHLVPGGGLAAHEGVNGGHTLAKHVGKSPEFLRKRLATEPEIKGASTFYNREVAENSIAEVLNAHDKRIQSWLAGPKRTLLISSPTPQVCGSVLLAPAADPLESSVIRVVLRRSDALGLGYRIHTAMVIM